MNQYLLKNDPLRLNLVCDPDKLPCLTLAQGESWTLVFEVGEDVSLLRIQYTRKNLPFEPSCLPEDAAAKKYRNLIIGKSAVRYVYATGQVLFLSVLLPHTLSGMMHGTAQCQTLL